jgi:type I restriction-modification system DNA methylase subunit
MSTPDQAQLGNTLWKIADELCGAMNADQFRDYMLSFLFLRYLSDNYETAAKKELGQDFRFKSYGLAPKSAADFAFLLHGFHFLSKEA